MKNILFFSPFLLLLTCSCHFSANKNQQTANKMDSIADSSVSILTAQLKEVKKNDTLDDIASFISGMKPSRSDLVAFKDSSPLWNKYQASADRIWKKADTTYMKKLKRWQNSEISTSKGANGDLFYPFSGPDIFTAYSLFPHSKRYVLIALEPVGNLPDLSRMNDANLSSYLQSLTFSFKDVLNTSFFLTNNMANDFNNNVINGVLPVLCLFLKRADCIIMNIEYLDNETFRPDVLSNPVGYKDKDFHNVRITFFQKGENEAREVYYIQADLSDPSFSSNKPLLTFLNTLNSPCTYLKSASYLLHRPSFSSIRSYILDKSQAVLQDDSGIPYKYFDNTKWDVQLYGKYTRPIKLFEQRHQADLKAAYDSLGTVKSLPVKMGYGSGSNILKATRKH